VKYDDNYEQDYSLEEIKKCETTTW
jgi:hypothetical protein